MPHQHRCGRVAAYLSVLYELPLVLDVIVACPCLDGITETLQFLDLFLEVGFILLLLVLRLRRVHLPTYTSNPQPWPQCWMITSFTSRPASCHTPKRAISVREVPRRATRTRSHMSSNTITPSWTFLMVRSISAVDAKTRPTSHAHQTQVRVATEHAPTVAKPAGDGAGPLHTLQFAQPAHADECAVPGAIPRSCSPTNPINTPAQKRSR